ncbi:MAG: ATP-binding cassette domain-containing protein [candidate division WOR-3 bacterium]|nr:ATP-binding cassette domain-containing protein [candidate division WOR-3 bacterium]MCX7757433.1 ATP-binding cassette domain-containing protein [candidate division WOR-3 bacterium]MDW7988188.1 ATP-binding cassette domain-containing protein [candidate division WOR-3 bacterium]
MIIFDNVTKVFENKWTALFNINLKISKGEFVFVVGPTGAGKSTLLRLIYGGDKITSGRLQVFNYLLNNASDKDITNLRRKIGIIFQDFKLLMDRTVSENIEFALRVIGIKENLIPHIIADVLNKVGLYNRRDFYPYQLSGGEQQKIAIARAIAKNPEILLADEPTANIDYKGSDEIIGLLKEINYSGTTVIMATHDHILAETSKKRIIRLENGKIRSDGN